jgi:hypothetical protein
MKTLKELEKIPREYLFPSDVAAVLDINPQDIRDHVHTATAKHERPYEFPTIVSGNRVKFPKEAFINFMRGKPA